MAFDDKERPAPKVSVKQQPNKSIFDSMPKKPSKQEFEKKAAEVDEQLNSYAQRAAVLAPQYKKLLDDKTLPINKNPFSDDLEKEVVGNLVKLAMDMNVDEYEKEGSGSVGLCALLLRCLLIQRDKINNLDYTVTQLKAEIKDIKSAELDKSKPNS